MPRSNIIETPPFREATRSGTTSAVSWTAVRRYSVTVTDNYIGSVKAQMLRSHEPHEITALDRLSGYGGDDGAADDAIAVG
jgi:hypothetical protein